ncbi:MAG: hypothetical protein K6G15_00115 [Desulfovibrio sp.]|nr:hypothetical protein [Desulfovibrio sp.]
MEEPKEKIGVREDFLTYYELLNRWKGRVSERVLIDMINRHEIIAYIFYPPFGADCKDDSGISIPKDDIVNMRPNNDELVLIDENPGIAVKNSKGYFLVFEGMYDQYGIQHDSTIYFEKKAIAEFEQRNPHFLSENVIPLPEERITRLEVENAELRTRIAILEKMAVLRARIAGLEKTRSEWSKEYPLFASMIEKIESGMSRQELSDWLKTYKLPATAIGFLIKDDTDIVQPATLRQNVHRLKKEK